MQTSGVLVAALLASNGLAAVVPTLGGSKTHGSNIGSRSSRHSVVAARNPTYSPSGPLALAKVHLKFGKAVPADTNAAVALINAERKKKRATGTVATAPTSYDSEYLTPVAIGTPAQQFNLDFDTGSSDLWVFSTSLPASEVNGQSQFNPSTSTSAKQVTNAKWSISYGDGSSSSGTVYTDSVTIGGLTVTNQAVEPASTVSSSFTSDSASDGLVGLAFSSINTVSPTAQKTFWDNAAAQGLQNVFTADLQHSTNGTYNFGFIDSTAYTGSIAYTKVDNSSGFWGFTATGYSVGSGSTSGSASIKGIADTGTTLMLMPDTVVNAYYSQVSGAAYSSSQGGVTFPCTATLPNFAFGVGSTGNSTTITVPGSYINYAPVDTAGTTCYGGIQSDSSIGFSIFGDVALKSAFVVFDGGNGQLGFANKAAAVAAAGVQAASTGSSAATTTAAAAAATTSAGKKGSGKKGKGNGKNGNGKNKQGRSDDA